jgi:hypothetical protein
LTIPSIQNWKQQGDASGGKPTVVGNATNDKANDNTMTNTTMTTNNITTTTTKLDDDDIDNRRTLARGARVEYEEAAGITASNLTHTGDEVVVLPGGREENMRDPGVQHNGWEDRYADVCGWTWMVDHGVGARS